MKAYININQKAFSDIAKINKVKIDLADAAIFNWITTFTASNKALKQMIDGKLYIWCSYKKIIDDNPLLGIGCKRTIERRLSAFVKIGLLKKFMDKDAGNMTYFNITDFAYSAIIECKPLCIPESKGLEHDNPKVSTSESETLCTSDSYNSKLDNSKLNSKLSIVANKISDVVIEKTQSDLDAEKIADLLYSKILTEQPEFKGKKESWIADIEKCIRIDGRDLERLSRCIGWIYTPAGEFWRANVLSGKKLRANYDQMELQAKRNNQTKGSQTDDMIRKLCENDNA